MTQKGYDFSSQRIKDIFDNRDSINETNKVMVRKENVTIKKEIIGHKGVTEVEKFRPNKT